MSRFVDCLTGETFFSDVFSRLTMAFSFCLHDARQCVLQGWSRGEGAAVPWKDSTHSDLSDRVGHASVRLSTKGPEWASEGRDTQTSPVGSPAQLCMGPNPEELGDASCRAPGHLLSC